MSYYYLIASLPVLAIGQSPISAEAFESRCAAELCARDYEALQQIAQIPLPENALSHAFAKEWNNLETQLRNAIARKRANKRQEDPTPTLRSHGGYATIIEDAVDNAWAQSNPLERERSLDTLRWSLLEDLTGPDPFSFNVILSYAVKRNIAERWASMDPEAGWTKASESFEQPPAGEDRPDEPETASTQTGSQT